MTRTAQAIKPHQAPARDFDWNDPAQRTPLVLLSVITLLLIVAYWNMLTLTASFWSDGLYSHGWLVPAFAGVLLWLRRQPFRPVPTIDRWAGLGILLLGLAMRIGGAMFYSDPVDRLSFLVVLLGAFLMVGGWHLIRWAGPAIGFLIFMYPLPSRLEMRILGRMQEWATIASTLVFQALGFTAIRRGNVIEMSEVPSGQLNVAEACSGLRMATIFIALSVAIVLLVERPWWDKVAILVSSIPIALFVNVVRITMTGLLWMTPLGENETTANFIAHDLSGYMMPIMAMGLMWLELWILSMLMVPEDRHQMMAMGVSGRRPAPGTG
jgi:exosortase